MQVTWMIDCNSKVEEGACDRLAHFEPISDLLDIIFALRTNSMCTAASMWQLDEQTDG